MRGRERGQETERRGWTRDREVDQWTYRWAKGQAEGPRVGEAERQIKG